MSATNYAAQVLDELAKALTAVDDAAVDALASEIDKASSIFVAGAGRSGLAMRAFAMRLMHLGRQVYVVGETTTPGITERDLLIIGSGSGATQSLVAIASRARNEFGAPIALLTIYPQSAIGQLAQVLVTIEAPTTKVAAAGARAATSIQPMGALFEQALFILLDIVILKLMDRAGEASTTMFKRHANLE